jgi:hypothetical protein
LPTDNPESERPQGETAFGACFTGLQVRTLSGTVPLALVGFAGFAALGFG